jgi:hypothetical protein
MHTPALHPVAGAAHVTPHAPQFAGSVVVSTHEAPHNVCVPGQRHALAVHVSAAGHATLHAPQFALSVVMSTHAPPHCINGGEHIVAHVPPLHRRPVAHGRLQLPQLAVSVRTFTQCPLHGVDPAGHEQIPAAHDCPVGQTCPHDPQFVASVSVLTQPAAQRI